MNYTGYSSPRSNAVVLNLISVHLIWENAQWMLGCNPFIVIELDITDIMNMLIILDLDNLNLLTLLGKNLSSRLENIRVFLHFLVWLPKIREIG